MGFNNLAGDESMDTIPVAVVSEGSGGRELIQALESVRITEDKKLFQVYLKNLKAAGIMLENGQIAGYIIYSDNPVLTIKSNGMEQSVIKSFVDSYLHRLRASENITDINTEAVKEDIMKISADNKNYLMESLDTDKNPDYTLIYFYSLISLTCMFGTNWGFREMADIQANQSEVGARITLSPCHKMKLLLCNLLAAFTLHYISVLFLLTFLNKILRVGFGHRTGMILLTCMFGSLCGIALGAMVCVSVKANRKVRRAILNVIIMGGGFLSGMVIADVKYIIDTKAPVIGYLNPSGLITDAFYCLYYYDGYDRLFRNLFMLSILTIVFGAVAFFEIRRYEYASI